MNLEVLKAALEVLTIIENNELKNNNNEPQ